MVKFLKSLKWILLPTTIAVFLYFIEAATDRYGISGSEEELLMYITWILVIVNACLFIFSRKWNDLVDSWF